MFKRKTFVVIVFLIAVCGLDDNFYYSTSGGFKCLKCPPGTFVQKDCTSGFPNTTTCEPCPDGRYSPEWNMVYLCKECGICKSSVGEVLVLSCNKTHDTKCGCKPGHFHENAHDPSSSKCIEYKMCGEGTGVILPVPLEKDVTCEVCVEGHNFSDVTSYNSPCQKCRDCKADGWNVTKDCTVRSNTICDIKTTKPPTSDAPLTHPTPTGDHSVIPPGPGEKENFMLGVTLGSLFGILVFIVVVVVIVFCYCKLRNDVNIFDRCFRRTKDNRDLRQSGSPPPSTFNSMAALNRHSHDGGHVDAHYKAGVNGACNVHTPLGQRRPSLILRLELDTDEFRIFDVIFWLGRELGNDHQNFIKKLQGDMPCKSDWDQPDHDRKALPDATVYRLEKWKETNPDISDDDLLTQFYWVAHEMERTDIRDSLKQFARPIPENVLHQP